ncbi:MAG: MarR family transcriptional regulator [Deltaproteobacteria bacterium]|nr:MarR family transcriptional regulator [Deltaproteobacteria bacterium]
MQVDRIVETIIYLYTESRRLTKEQAARHGLTGPQLSVAKILEDLGDLSLSELSEKINAQNSTVTGIVDRMEREGLVERKRSSDDRRVVHIRLTRKGHELARSLNFEPFEIFRSAFERALTREELGQLLTLLDKITTYVRKEVQRGDDEAAS